MGKVGDYYLDKKNYNLYGPKSKKGWGTSIQLKGADGNANVTRYVFTSGYDFTANNRFYSVIMEGGRNALMNSAWLTYLVREHHGTANVLYYYQIPGMAASNTIYSVSYYNSDYVSQNVYVNIVKENGVVIIINKLLLFVSGPLILFQIMLLAVIPEMLWTIILLFPMNWMCQITRRLPIITVLAMAISKQINN